MTYTLYIDESGSFESDNDRSIVGGFVTNIPLAELSAEIDKTIKETNAEQATDFTTNDIHLAPLLHPENTGKEAEQKRFAQIAPRSRQAFADKLYATLQRVSLHYFISHNQGFSFGEGDPQQRYGSNLCALVNSFIEYIKDKDLVENVEIFIAPRSPKCLPSGSNFRLYHERLVAYISSLVKRSLDINKIKVSYSLKAKVGFDYADIACYYLRKKRINKSVSSTAPNQRTLSGYQKAQDDFMSRLIENNELSTAYRYAESQSEKDRILTSLTHAHEVVKATEIPLMINIAHALIMKRTTQRLALDEASKIFTTLFNICHKTTDNDMLNTTFSRLSGQALEGCMQCINHKGDTKRQEVFFEKYRQLIEANSTIPYFTRQEQQLSARVKAYNQEFNSYQFSNIISEFEAIVLERVKSLPPYEKDILTGEMLGTIGQAYAFQAGRDTSLFHNAEAYIKQSIHHFSKGSPGHKMAINFLTSLYSECETQEKALQAFAQHKHIETSGCSQKYLHKVLHSKNPDFSTAFDLTVLMRIANRLGETDQKNADALEQFLLENCSESHPYQLLYQQLGLARLILGQDDKALQALMRAQEVAKDQMLAVQITLVPGKALAAVIRIKNNPEDREKILTEFADITHKLTEQCQGFATYLETLGGTGQMLYDIKKEKIKSISRWLPFTYN